MTHTTKHTPGPWELSSTHRDEQYIEEPKAEELRPLFRIHWDNDVTDHEAEQGANLIAAAPAMYEALSKLVKYLREEVADEALDTWEPVFKAAMALAQAEGR